MADTKTGPDEAHPQAHADIAPQHDTPVTHIPELQEALQWLKQYGMSIVIGVGVAVVIILGMNIYNSWRRARALEADRMLFKAETPKQLREVLDRYPRMDVAPLAMLKLARNEFDAGNYAEAEKLYDEFGKKHSGHALALAGAMGKIHCIEARGQTEQALKAYGEFAAAHKDHFLATTAIFGRARCLRQLKQYAQAKAVYEEFIGAHPASAWTTPAENAIKEIEVEIKRAQPEAPPATTPAKP